MCFLKRNLDPSFKWHQMILTQQLSLGKPLSGELPALTKQQCVAILRMKLAELQGTSLITRTLLQSAYFLLCPWLLAEHRLQSCKCVVIQSNRLKEVLAHQIRIEVWEHCYANLCTCDLWTVIFVYNQSTKVWNLVFFMSWIGTRQLSAANI